MSRKSKIVNVDDITVDSYAVRSVKEEAALKQLKSRLSDVLKEEHTDIYLVKWLRARALDPVKAEDMFRTSIAYRTKMNVDKLKNDYNPPEVLRKYLPATIYGEDKEGHPLIFDLQGRTDMKGIIYSAKKSDIEKTKLLQGERILEILVKQSEKHGKLIEGCTTIIDMDGETGNVFWMPGMKMYSHMGRVLQDNYPEVIKRTFIVNAPKFFPLLWQMIKPLVTEDMKRKVTILGQNYEEELLKYIDADQLPAFLGGNLKDPDGNERCATMIIQGGKVPEEYYVKDLADTVQMQKSNIGRGDKLKKETEVFLANSTLRWEFKTDNYDVGFGLFYKTKSGLKELIPTARVNSNYVPENGTWTCSSPGMYVLVFDNTYSWARGKTIYYNIDVVTPVNEETRQDLNRVVQGGDWDRIAEKTETTRL